MIDRECEIAREKEMRVTEKVSARFDGERERAREMVERRRKWEVENAREIESDGDS